MRAHGIENFIIEEIEECTKDNINERERYWIKYYNARDPEIGYNICQGGEGGCGGPHFAGHNHSEETKQKMSDDRQGEKNANYGNRWHHTPDMNYKYDGENNPMFGHNQSDEAKAKIGLANSTPWMTNGEEDIKVSWDDIELYQFGYRRGRTFGGRKPKEQKETEN